jgi:hypothetical protein
MEWVPSSMWLTYLQLSADAGDLDYDLAMATHADALPTLADTGVPMPDAHPVTPSGGDGFVTWPLVVGVLSGFAMLAMLRSRRSIVSPVAP